VAQVLPQLGDADRSVHVHEGSTLRLGYYRPPLDTKPLGSRLDAAAEGRRASH
jgi:hypothetical protein